MTTVAGAEAAAARALLVAVLEVMIATAGTALGRRTAAARWRSGTVIMTTSATMTSGTRCEAHPLGEALQRQGAATTVTVSVIGQQERAVTTADTLAAARAVSTAALQASSSNSSSMHSTMVTTTMMEGLAAAALLVMQVVAATPTRMCRPSTATAMQAAAVGIITMPVVAVVVLAAQSMAMSAAAAARAAAGRACNLRLLLQQLGLAVSTRPCRCVLHPATPTLVHRRRSSTGGLGSERTVGRTTVATAGALGLAAAI